MFKKNVDIKLYDNSIVKKKKKTDLKRVRKYHHQDVQVRKKPNSKRQQQLPVVVFLKNLLSLNSQSSHRRINLFWLI